MGSHLRMAPRRDRLVPTGGAASAPSFQLALNRAVFGGIMAACPPGCACPPAPRTSGTSARGLLLCGQDRARAAGLGGRQVPVPDAPAAVRQDLCLDTLAELYAGNEALFRGLTGGTGRDAIRWFDWASREAASSIRAICSAPRRGSWRASKGGWEYAIRSLRRMLRIGSPNCWKSCTARSSGGRWCWWTGTTSRSWTRSATGRPPRPTGTTCAVCSAPSRTATRTSRSAS